MSEEHAPITPGSLESIRSYKRSLSILTIDFHAGIEYPFDMKSNGLSKADIPASVVAVFWSRVDVRSESQCWEWRGTRHGKFGYGQIGFNKKYFRSHVIAFVLCKRDVPPGLCVLHKCDNPPCCNPKHLWLGTKAENNKDRSQKGREGYRKGSANGRALLTERSVREIRIKALDGNYSDIARAYGVKTVTVAKIVQRKLWKHVA